MQNASEIPWNTKKTNRIAFIDNDKVQMRQSRTKVEEFLKDSGGEWKIIQLNREGRIGLQGSRWKDAVEGKHVDYVAVRNFKSEPIKFEQIPYRDGPPRSFEKGTYTSQPDLEFSYDSAGRPTRVFYKGDTTLMQHVTPNEAKTFGRYFNDARKLYSAYKKAQKDGGKAKKELREFSRFVDEKFPWWGTDEVIAQLEKRFKPDIPVFARGSGTNTNEAGRVEKWVKDNYPDVEFVNTVDDPHSLDNALDFSKKIKREPLGKRVSVEGTEDNPIFNLEKPVTIRPSTTISRQMHSAVKGRYFDDLKMTYANQFVREHGEILDVPADMLKIDPVGALLNGKLKDSVDYSRYRSARAFQRHAQNFFGMRNDSQRRAENLVDRMAQAAYKRWGVKGLTKIHDSKAIAAISDPATLLRTMAFHSSMGFFNPVQLFVQSQTHVNIAALEGPTTAMSAMSAAWVQGALLKNWKGHMPKAMAKKVKAFGWTEEEFLESWEGLKASGFWNVGTEVVERDSLGPTMNKSGFFDVGLVFFELAEAYTRRTAWNAAYLKWRRANPGAKFDNNAMVEVLSRADFTTNTMGRNGKAAWNNGFASVPTQFWNWNARMVDNMLGTRMTNAERARLITAHGLMYGLPVASGAAVVGQVVPFDAMIRDYLAENNIDYNESIVAKLAMDGLTSVVLEGVTGEKWNVGARYGTGNLPLPEAIYNMLRGRTTLYEGIVESLGGAGGSFVQRLAEGADPAGAAIYAAFDYEDPAWLSRTGDEFLRTLSHLGTSIDNTRKTMMAMNFQEYTTRAGNPVESTAFESMVNLFTGLSTQKRVDDYMAMSLRRGLEGQDLALVKEAKRMYRASLRAFRAGDDETANSYMRAAKDTIRFGAPNKAVAEKMYERAFGETQDYVKDSYEWLRDNRGMEMLENKRRNSGQ